MCRHNSTTARSAMWHKCATDQTSPPAFSIDNNYHYNLSQLGRQDQKPDDLLELLFKIVSCETIKKSHFDSD